MTTRVCIQRSSMNIALGLWITDWHRLQRQSA
jgi:hypothetical protein